MYAHVYVCRHTNKHIDIHMYTQIDMYTHNTLCRAENPFGTKGFGDHEEIRILFLSKPAFWPERQ